jgi:hypothetical protein
MHAPSPLQTCEQLVNGGVSQCHNHLRGGDDQRTSKARLSALPARHKNTIFMPKCGACWPTLSARMVKPGNSILFGRHRDSIFFRNRIRMHLRICVHLCSHRVMILRLFVMGGTIAYLSASQPGSQPGHPQPPAAIAYPGQLSTTRSLPAASGSSRKTVGPIPRSC